MEFVGIVGANYTVIAPIPTNGPDAIVSNSWYHVAVTYDGNEGAAGNFKVYWTLMDPSRTSANLIYTDSLPLDLPIGAPDFCVGNTGRNTPNGNFLGLTDEIRISDIARDPTGMMFVGASVGIISGPSPTNQVANIGQTVSFNVSATGAATVKYQWLTNGVGILGATNATYTIASAQLGNAGNYTVIVSNTFSAVTSSVATLTMQTPLALTWLGQTTADWDNTTTNWVDALVNNQNFLNGDGVTFDATGSGQPIVSLAISVAPSNMVVDASTDYTITGGGSITGPTKLTKKNTGSLILDVNSTHTGGTEIQSGIVQVGNNTARGSLGTGAISNGTAIVFNRSDTALTLNNNISGPGSLTNNCTTVAAIVTLTGSNTFTGDIMINSGMLMLGSTNALGNCTNIVVLNPTVNGAYGTRLGMSGGVTIGASVGITMYSGFGGRASIYADSGTNFVNTPVFLIDQSPSLDLTTYNLGTVGASTRLVMNGAITTATFDGTFLIRGGGTVVINASIVLPLADVAVTTGNTWVLNSTGNSWRYSEIASGMIVIGANNALPVTIPLLIADRFDLAGFNQQLESLQDYNGATSGVVGNSSTTSDSVLTLLGTSNAVYNGVIQDVIGTGTRKMGLTLDGGFSYTLSGNCNYSGPTTVLAGTLALATAGDITNTATINLAAGTTLDASTRNDVTLTVNPGQTLKGNAAFNVTGNLTNRGTIELKLNKAGATLTNDSVHGLTGINYGGTLKLTITASPALTTSDSFPLFFAGAYSGAFSSLVPSVPVFGLAWDTSTLSTDGTLRIMAGPNTTPTNITSSVSGNNLTLSWPSDHTGWRLQAQTNSVNTGISNNWFDVAGSSTTNLLILPVDLTKGTVFYRMIYP
ncbi:MAG: hypothetical protein EXS24_00240 [Pedosphaera sp.]|nr:hypothetical protein [Pedosphaera sp.]